MIIGAYTSKARKPLTAVIVRNNACNLKPFRLLWGKYFIAKNTLKAKKQTALIKSWLIIVSCRICIIFLSSYTFS